MKILLAFLIAGMVFLVTPVSASADRGGRHNSRQKYDQWQVQRDHNYKQQHNQYNRHHNQGYDQKYNHRGKRDLRWKPRGTRCNLYRVKRQIGHNHRHTYYVHQPAVLFGIPPLVFLFD